MPLVEQRAWALAELFLRDSDARERRKLSADENINTTES